MNQKPYLMWPWGTKGIGGDLFGIFSYCKILSELTVN